MHGLGNDFVFLDHFSVVEDEDYSKLAKKLCHRQFGIGGDGLVVILPSKVADARMHSQQEPFTSISGWLLKIHFTLFST